MALILSKRLVLYFMADKTEIIKVYTDIDFRKM